MSVAVPAHVSSSALSPATTFMLGFVLTLGTAMADLQTLQLKGASGQIEEIWSNVQDLGRVSKLLEGGDAVTEICATNSSRWIAFHNVNYSIQDPASLTYTLLNAGGGAGSADDGHRCTSGYPQIKSARHIGNLDTAIPSLSLYEQRNFRGLELFFSGSRLDLPKPVFFHSAGFTGGSDVSWELHQSAAAGGRQTTLQAPVCLERGRGSDPMYPWALPQYSGVQIKRIIRGCRIGSHRVKRAGEGPTEGAGATVPSQSIYLSDGATTGYGEQRPQQLGLFMEGSELRLTKSYIFYDIERKGGTDWQLFSGLAYDGDSYCLSTDRIVIGGDGLQVGSIKIGCEHEVGAELEELPEAYKHLRESSGASAPTNICGTLHQLWIILIALALSQL